MAQMFPFPIGTVHIVGIGGIGMSGYAEVLHRLGYAVQGSDAAENANVIRLRALGLRVFVGHDPAHLQDAAGHPVAVVVRSTAVRDDNPEVAGAQARRIPVIARVDLLAEMMRSRWCVNVSGTHGKTTTTSMVGRVLEQAGMDPTVINGGIVNAYGSNARMGEGDWMVVESDESDGTFARLPSVVSVITNIDPEHMDYYGSFEAVKEAYLDYAHHLPFYGFAVACLDHPVVAELIPRIKRRVVTYGFSDKADVQAFNARVTGAGQMWDMRIGLSEGGAYDLCDVFLPMYGPHNILNALAAFAVGTGIGIAAEKVKAALAGFSGVRRRFTVTGVAQGVTVVDDYGHHPVEIAAVLKAARDALEARGGGRLIAVVQPHRYSRLSSLFDSFSTCFSGADVVIVADVYAAGEQPIAGTTRDALASGIRHAGHGEVHVLEGPAHLAPLVSELARPGDFVVCLGAGNITQWAQALPRELEEIADSGKNRAAREVFAS